MPELAGKRFVVVGATGLLGAAVCRQLAAAGAMAPEIEQAPSIATRAAVDGALAALDAAAGAEVPRFVLASSTAVYGDTVADPITETTPFGAAGLAPAYALYGLKKLLAEQAGQAVAARTGMQVVAFRYSTLYGVGLHERAINGRMLLAAYRAIRAGQPPQVPGDGRSKRDFLNVEDATRAALQALRFDDPPSAVTATSGLFTTILAAIQGSSRRQVPTSCHRLPFLRYHALSSRCCAATSPSPRDASAGGRACRSPTGCASSLTGSITRGSSGIVVRPGC